MNISKDIKITLNKEEQEAVEKVNRIVEKFVDRNLCDKMPCGKCPLNVFCPSTDCTNFFEETLNDIANME